MNTDYVAEAFHYQLKNVSRYEEVNNRVKLGAAIEGRDEKGIKKTLCALLKLLHPDGPPTDEEFDEYTEYTVESRRRVKEQMNKRKPDDEFAKINISFFDCNDEERIVFCPARKGVAATQEPDREETPVDAGENEPAVEKSAATEAVPVTSKPAEERIVEENENKQKDLDEQHFTIKYSDTGHTYELGRLSYSVLQFFSNAANLVSALASICRSTE